jgi:L-malate glycosyltransferase
LAELLNGNYATKAVSTQTNKYLRLMDMAANTLFGTYNWLVIDVYSTQAFMFAQIAAKLGKIRGKKIVLVLHGGGLPNLYQKNPEKVNLLFKIASKLVSPSNYLKEYFSEHGFNIQVIPNSKDLSVFTYKTDNVKQYSILWVRAFRNIYNPQIPIQALKLVHNKFPQATLTMVGPDDGLMGECKQLAENLGVANSIEFKGSIPNTALPQLYHSHQVFLNTTSLESFGVAVVEAAMCGIPVVTSKVGEIPYMWQDGEDVLMTEEITPEEFSQKIEMVFSNPTLENQLKENAHKKSLQYDWENVKQHWFDLFDTVK